MSIPERLYHLARGKIGEIRDMFDRQDTDADLDPELLERIRSAQARKSARRELENALDGEPGPQGPSTFTAPPTRAQSALRTPEQIRTVEISGGAASSAATAAGAATDPLAAHYLLLGLEPGTDYATVQAVYEKLLARCRPDRFPEGSPERREAQDIEDRLEATYKVLHEALDPTARRFDMLEI
jgi:hypothetical protein